MNTHEHVTKRSHREHNNVRKVSEAVITEFTASQPYSVPWLFLYPWLRPSAEPTENKPKIEE
jgi:hypothetical protein